MSGSGKSSLVFDIIAKEGQRRYFETLPSFARQFMGKLNRPEVDGIEGLSPVIAIRQRTTGMHARSTVGTATDIYASLRLLFSRVGKPFVGYSNVFSFNHPQGMCSSCNGLGFVNSINTHTLFDKTKLSPLHKEVGIFVIGILHADVSFAVPGENNLPAATIVLC